MLPIDSASSITPILTHVDFDRCRWVDFGGLRKMSITLERNVLASSALRRSIENNFLYWTATSQVQLLWKFFSEYHSQNLQYIFHLIGRLVTNQIFYLFYEEFNFLSNAENRRSLSLSVLELFKKQSHPPTFFTDYTTSNAFALCVTQQRITHVIARC